MTPFVVVIPARYASSRFPGKPLVEINGKPMVAHVVDRARESGATEVIVATDDERIAKAASAHDCTVSMTRNDHATGTDRIAEVADQRGWTDDTIVVNAQGDEPLLPPSMIRTVAQALQQHDGASISTACHPIRDIAEFLDPNAVKVVFDAGGYALYFSRAPIPWPRDAFAADEKTSLPTDLPAFRHIGIYAYRCEFLRKYATLAPATVERFESLEQLRAMSHGYRIAVTVSDKAPPPGIDTPDDLKRLRDSMAPL
jgi:3-deoxy-manno-octulosonate cytidylyltransferase (CMP-KDO synthetase)